jgi:hypothetical protein
VNSGAATRKTGYLEGEASVAKAPSSKTDLAALRASILIPPRWIFDPIDMEAIFQVNQQLGKQLTAQRLETSAEINRALAEGAAKAAKLLK